MTDGEKSQQKSDDENDDQVALNLGVLRINMTGQLVKTLTPYIGWSMVFMAIAYAVALVIGALQDGP